MSARPSAHHLDADRVEELLHGFGWPSTRINPDTWQSRFKGQNGSFPVLVRLDSRHGYLSFAIVPFVRSPREQPLSEPLYRRLLELNHSLLMAKLSIDDDLDVVLSVDYPTEHLNESEFQDALDVLSYYADRCYPEVRRLCG